MWRTRGSLGNQVRALHFSVFPCLAWCSVSRRWTQKELQAVKTAQIRMTQRIARWWPKTGGLLAIRQSSSMEHCGSSRLVALGRSLGNDVRCGTPPEPRAPHARKTSLGRRLAATLGPRKRTAAADQGLRLRYVGAPRGDLRGTIASQGRTVTTLRQGAIHVRRRRTSIFIL